MNSFIQAVLYRKGDTVALVRLIGFTTLDCGCVIGRYREIGTQRELAYVEEKGASCTNTTHRRSSRFTEPPAKPAEPRRKTE